MSRTTSSKLIEPPSTTPAEQRAMSPTPEQQARQERMASFSKNDRR